MQIASRPMTVAKPVAKSTIKAAPASPSTLKEVEGVAAQVATTAVGAVGGYVGLGEIGMKYGGEVVGPILGMLWGAGAAVVAGGLGCWLGNKLRHQIEGQ